jgi:hypothetical protein
VNAGSALLPVGRAAERRHRAGRFAGRRRNFGESPFRVGAGVRYDIGTSREAIGDPLSGRVAQGSGRRVIGVGSKEAS